MFEHRVRNASTSSDRKIGNDCDCWVSAKIISFVIFSYKGSFINNKCTTISTLPLNLLRNVTVNCSKSAARIKDTRIYRHWLHIPLCSRCDVCNRLGALFTATMVKPRRTYIRAAHTYLYGHTYIASYTVCASLLGFLAAINLPRVTIPSWQFSSRKVIAAARWGIQWCGSFAPVSPQ